ADSAPRARIASRGNPTEARHAVRAPTRPSRRPHALRDGPALRGRLHHLRERSGGCSRRSTSLADRPLALGFEDARARSRSTDPEGRYEDVVHTSPGRTPELARGSVLVRRSRSEGSPVGAPILSLCRSCVPSWATLGRSTRCSGIRRRTGTVVRTPSGYERLSVLDNVFLLAETPSVHMHVAAIQIFEAGGVPNVDGGIHAEEFKRRVRAVIHLFPRCRQRLRWTPVEHHPVWVDHDGFDLDDHVQIASLPRPGTDAQLKLLCASILETQLDRGRPLWEIWLIEGLARDRFAILCKFHHCMIDGAGGADLMSVLLSPTRDPQTPEPRPYVPRPLPSSWNLLRDSMSRLGDLPFKFAHDVARFA